MRNLVLLLTAVVVLVLVNVSIWQRETLITHGRTLLLELAPVDPRSLMQGDYMALRFRITGDAFPPGSGEVKRDGRLVVAVDARNVGTFRRFGESVQGGDEALLRYRVRHGQPKFATNAFFFQERQGEYYRNARYGEFRVSPDGEALLVALRDADLQVLGPSVAGGR